jgi:nucleoside-diphosphate-sugar epimerase
VRVVVTGATGNVGTAVVETLVADPRIESIVGISRRGPGGWAPPKTRFVTADVAGDPLTPHLRGADAVVHLAWLFQPSHRPTVTWRANVEGSERVLDAVVRANVPALVHASSIGAYSRRPADDHLVDESWPTHSRPTAAYGREKAYVERLLDAFELDNPDTRVVRMRPAFIFRRASATEQRRLFAGPFLPGRLLRPGRLPMLPYPSGLRFQALHTGDVGRAYASAVTQDVRGAFNLAAEPVLDGPSLAEILGARPVRLPQKLVRAAVAAAWHGHVVPADPHLFDLFMELPLIDTTRARAELGWRPVHTGREAMREVIEGFATGAGGPTPPLAEDRVDRRVGEVARGVGQRA